MKFLSAEVEVKIDDSRLPAQLAKAKSAVTRTVAKIRAAFKSMAVSFKAAFDKMVRIAKYAAVGIAAALALATRAAMKQEDAVFLLGAALKIAGEYSEKTMESFKAFASEIQRATIYGDEFVLSLMQQLKSLGVHSSQLEEATKMVIGLKTATGKGMEAMIMATAALVKGDTQLLTRYIPDLRTATNETEKLRLATQLWSHGFELAVEQATTTSGRLKQAWNALGDALLEAIGKPLLEPLTKSAVAIKEWAERNQERIEKWAEETVRSIGRVKDTFFDWVRYLKTDWKAALGVALDVAVILLKGFWETSVVLMEAAGRAAGRAFISAFGEPITKFADEWLAASFWERLIDPAGSAMYAVVGGWAVTIKEYNKKMAEGTIKEAESTWEKLKQIGIKKAAEIKATELPAAALAKPASLYPEGELVSTLSDEWQTLLDVAQEGYAKLDAMAAASGSTAQEAVEGTVKGYQRMLDAMDFEYDMLGKISQERERALSMARFKVELEKEFGVEQLRAIEQQIQYNELMDEYIEKLDRIAEGQRGQAAFFIELKRWGDEASNTWKNLGEITVRSLNRTADALTDMVMTGKADFKSLAQSILADLTRMIMRQMLFNALFGGVGGGGGGLFGALLGGLGGLFRGGGSVASGGATNAQAVAAFAPSLQYGGEVASTGLAVVHRGETFSGVGVGVGGNESRPLEISIQYHGQEQPEITSAEEYLLSDRRIIEVTMQAAQFDGSFRRAIKAVARP